jgi:hypothetical protein
MQLVFPLPPGHVKAAIWQGVGFFTQRGNITISVDTIMTQQNVFQFSGIVAMRKALRLVAA